MKPNLRVPSLLYRAECNMIQFRAVTTKMCFAEKKFWKFQAISSKMVVIELILCKVAASSFYKDFT